MPVFEATQTFSRPVAEVFDFFCRPANLVRISPPELHLALVEGPERVELGSRIVLKGRRWGISQRVVSQITAFEPEVSFADEQVEGLFRLWKHTHRFEALPEGGTRTTDSIEYESPGGALGLIVTNRFIDNDLRWVFDYRHQRLSELLSG
jgi:ligand-binding SRPBCC domain-containing protein